MVSPTFLILAALAVTSHVIASPHRPRPLPPHLKAKLDHGLSTTVQDKRVPGITALALNRDGSVIYANSFGTVNIDDPTSAPITSSTRMPIWSMTKAVVSVAALQLIEQKRLRLDDLVETYIPSWANLSVLAGFSSAGEPILRPPKSKAKVLHLFTHTAGPAYDIINANINAWTTWAASQTNPPPVPLASDPGTGWFYGTSTDTLGHIIETISGLRLDAYLNKHIFSPLGISPNTTGLVTPDIWYHTRSLTNNIITATPPFQPADDPFGGGYLISTITDYANFLLPLLNDGRHPISGVRILSQQIAKKYLFTDLYPESLTAPGYGYPPGPGPNPKKEAGDGIGNWTSSNPQITNSYTFFPEIEKGWSAPWLLNKEDIKGRRRKGSGAWAGVQNTYYWVDNKAGKLGIVMTNLAPFLDGEVLGLLDLLEGGVYEA